jgi:deoxyribodipyrimidine photo-lyase
MSVAVWWVRRDMRLADNKALQSAASRGDVAPLFVVDPVFASAGAARRNYMFATLRDLDLRMERALILRHGDPVAEVVQFAQAVGATSVHIAQDFAPYGIKRDAAVSAALAKAGIELVVADSPYVINPGTVLKDDGTPLKVFTPFYKRWMQFPFSSATENKVTFHDARSLCMGYPEYSVRDTDVFPVGEEAAWKRWDEWSAEHLGAYKEARNNPAIDGTSQLSAQLRFGVIHPRQLLKRLPGAEGADHFRSEIAWREFYADVLFHQPHTAWENLQSKMNALPNDTGDVAQQRFAAFCAGNTGYPIVDAGIRQMLATGYMHNRVRMIVASFLVKDLHVPWQWGAKFFMDHLIDGDLASNNHGWQWTAGTGTDAAPYFRVFNPTSQSEKFDPEGDYLRQWIPEIAHLDKKSIHDPSSLGLLAPADYVEPIVDHAVERVEALARYKAVSGK